jgi:competence protein ComGF
MVSVVVMMVAVVVVAMVAAMLYTHNGSDDTVDWFCFCFENVLEHGVSLPEDLVTTDPKHDD